MGYYTIVIPEYAENLIPNPSGELRLSTGWTITGLPDFIVSAEKQKFGAYSFNIDKDSTVGSNEFIETTDFMLVSPLTFYTFSFYYQKDVVNAAYTGRGRISWYTAANALISTVDMNLIAGDVTEWTRFISIASSPATAAKAKVRISTDGISGGITDIWIDGVSFVQANHATMYFDGDTEGAYWYGAPHASKSIRPASARLSGLEVNLDDYGFYIEEVTGTGMPPVSHLIQQHALLPGASLRGVKVQPRVFDLRANIIQQSYPALHAKRQALINAIKPDLVAGEEFLLRYYGANASRPVEIVCVYDTGLDLHFNSPDGFNEEINLRLIAYDPFWHEEDDGAAQLTTSQNVNSADRILAKTDGVWQALAGLGATVHAITFGPDGSLYAAGEFVNASGVAAADFIAKWDGTAWTALGTGTNNTILDMLVAADGSIYITGAFTSAGGVANTANIARWTGSAWQALGTGLNGTGRALALGPDGTLYVTGDFTLAGGVTDTIKVAKWNGSAWTPMGQGFNGNGWSLAVAPNGDIYAGGEFTTADNGALTVTVNRITRWNGSEWSNLGSGMNGTVYAIAVARSGLVYAGGAFTTAGGGATNRVAVWNGGAWAALGAGLNDTVYTLAIDPEGSLYVGGIFTTAGGLTLADRIAVWNGSTWAHLPANLPSTPTAYAFAFRSGDLYIGYTSSGTAATAALNTIVNLGSRTSYPIIIIKRSGGTSAIAEYLRNETTGKTIFLNYSLLDNETLTLDFRPSKHSAVSSFFGNVIGRAVLRQSDFADFGLQPGENKISMFVNPVGSPLVLTYMQWKTTHWSADGSAG